MRTLLVVLLGLAMWPALAAPPLTVYSEFARIDEKGRVTAPERPREILSPALARNAFTSFQVVVEAEDGKSWWLHVGQNPENAVEVTMYRATGERLEKVSLPARGQGTQVFWMDLWTARTAPVERIKVEPQLNIDGDWVIYPMEARIMDAVVPEGERAAGSATPMDVARGFLCGTQKTAAAAPEGVTAPALRFRNAQQDLALAAKAPRAELQKLAGGCNAPLPANPEAYFPLRDYLFRQH